MDWCGQAEEKFADAEGACGLFARSSDSSDEEGKRFIGSPAPLAVVNVFSVRAQCSFLGGIRCGGPQVRGGLGYELPVARWKAPGSDLEVWYALARGAAFGHGDEVWAAAIYLSEQVRSG